jgi:hypothetical protein
MMGTVFAAVCMVTALLLTMSRVIPLRMILGYATIIDVVFSVGMLGVFAGTITGAMNATMAGLVLAITLSAGRWCIGYQRIVLKRSKSGITVSVLSVQGKAQEWFEQLRNRTTLAMTGLTDRFIT